DLRRIRKRKGEDYFILMTPKKKARHAVKAKVRDIIGRSGATPMPVVVKQINATLAGWVNYFRVGNASRAFSEVHDYVDGISLPALQWLLRHDYLTTTEIYLNL